MSGGDHGWKREEEDEADQEIDETVSYHANLLSQAGH